MIQRSAPLPPPAALLSTFVLLLHVSPMRNLLRKQEKRGKFQTSNGPVMLRLLCCDLSSALVHEGRPPPLELTEAAELGATLTL